MVAELAALVAALKDLGFAEPNAFRIQIVTDRLPATFATLFGAVQAELPSDSVMNASFEGNSGALIGFWIDDVAIDVV